MVDFAIGIGALASGFARGLKDRQEREDRDQLQALREEQNERERVRLQREIQRQDEARPGELAIQQETLNNLRTSGQNARDTGDRARQEEGRAEALRQAQRDAEAQGAASREEAIKSNIGKSIFRVEEQGPILDGKGLPQWYGSPGASTTYRTEDQVWADPGVRKRAEAHAGTLYNFINSGHVDQVVSAAMQAGNTQLAEAYPKWLEDKQVQHGLKLYTSGVGKFSIGDVDGGIDDLAAAYNARGYVDDGMHINILKKNRDPQTGNISTVELEIKNGQTGEAKRDTVGLEQFRNYAVQFLNPKNVAEYGFDHLKAEQKAAADLEQKRQEAQIDVEKARQKATGANPYAAGGFNDSQGKAATFADRMVQAHDVISDLTGINDSWTGWAGGIANNNMPEGLTNQFMSADRQKFNQASRNLINAILRRESGAVISRDEFDSAARQYIPQPGDSPEVLAQKRANRISSAQGIMREAGPNYQPPQGWGDPSNPPQGGAQAPRGAQRSASAPTTGGLNINAARQAPDGNWYVPDPSRPGKYLQVVRP
ncbi:hypothetical protein [Xanthobacter sediminis]